MEGQSSKRRRVYSPEPNKVVQATFPRNYVNYLVPALKKIKEKCSDGHNKHCDFQNIVKHEVDMAMVFSAQGFAWSDALKLKLQKGNCVNVDSSTSFDENEVGDKGLSRIYDQNEIVALDFSSNPSSMSPQAKILANKSKYIDQDRSNGKVRQLFTLDTGIDTREKKKVLSKENNEDEVINNQLKCLRRLIPGGEEMCNEQMAGELESYISCLQMQVNILQYLSETS